LKTKTKTVVKTAQKQVPNPTVLVHCAIVTETKLLKIKNKKVVKTAQKQVPNPTVHCVIVTEAKDY
jgi:hypothetical protein